MDSVLVAVLGLMDSVPAAVLGVMASVLVTLAEEPLAAVAAEAVVEAVVEAVAVVLLDALRRSLSSRWSSPVSFGSAITPTVLTSWSGLSPNGVDRLGIA